MVNFREAEFGDKFKFLPTGEICEYIAHSVDEAHLRPVDYNGLMVYTCNFNCLNSENRWEKYSESFKDCINNSKTLTRDLANLKFKKFLELYLEVLGFQKGVDSNDRNIKASEVFKKLKKLSGLLEDW